MPRLAPITIFSDCSEGVIQAVRPNLCPANSLDKAINVTVDEEYGSPKVRKGITLIGAQLAPAVGVTGGLYQFNDTSGSTKRLLTVASNGTTYYLNSGTWTSASLNNTAGLKNRFVSFLDYVVRLNGTDLPAASATGINWSTTGTEMDLDNMPKGKFGIVYKDQMIIAGVDGSPDSAFVSSVPSLAGAISWTTGNREIVFNPEDGQNVTGLGRVGNVLLVFKDHSTYRWNNRSTEPDCLIEVGCTSAESIVNCGSGLLSFFNEHGIWLTSGEQPILISRKVQKWINGMSASFYSSVNSYGDGEHLLVSIGDCTVDGVSYNNIVLRYTMETKEWVVYSYPYEFRILARYDDSGEIKIVGGDSVDRILQLESSATTDNGTAIGFQIESQEIDWGSRGTLKEITEMVVASCKNPAGGIVQIKGDDNDWVTLGVLDKEIKKLDIQERIVGHYFKFRVVGVSSTEAFNLLTLELPNVVIMDYGE